MYWDVTVATYHDEARAHHAPFVLVWKRYPPTDDVFRVVAEVIDGAVTKDNGGPVVSGTCKNIFFAYKTTFLKCVWPVVFERNVQIYAFPRND